MPGLPIAWISFEADGRSHVDAPLHRSPTGRWFFIGHGWLSVGLAALVEAAIERAGTAPDERFRVETEREAGERRGVVDQARGYDMAARLRSRLL
jgi:hypothetical protein